MNKKIKLQLTRKEHFLDVTRNQDQKPKIMIQN